MWTARSQLPSVHWSRRTWRAARGVVRPLPSCRHCWRRRGHCPRASRRDGTCGAGLPRGSGNVQRAFWTGALAAAAVFAIVVGISRFLPPSTALHRPAGQGWAAVTADYEQSAAELVATLVTERGRLRPETVALVERNLRIIDEAIRESRAALERDPGNAELRQLFAAAYRQKVELLRWATRVATSS